MEAQVYQKGYYLPLFTRKRKISGERFMRSYDNTVNKKLWKETRKCLFILRHILSNELMLNLAAHSSSVSRLIGKII